MNKNNVKVLIDTNVLVSASISQIILKLNCKVEHHFYEYSKPLIDYFHKNIKYRLGVVTPKIENSARRVLITAIEGKIKDLKDENLQEELKKMETYSYLLQESITNLTRNIDILVREPINEKEMKGMTHSVFGFYARMMEDLERENPDKIVNRQTSYVPSHIKGVARSVYKNQENKRLKLYYKLRNKFERDKPDIGDVQILSQAVYFLTHNIFGKDTKILLASTDHHFSKIREDKELNDFVPKAIYNNFRVYCDWPHEILKILKEEKKFPDWCDP